MDNITSVSRHDNESGPDVVNCSDAVRRFPSTLFSLPQIRHGAVLVHILIMLYTALAIGHVCKYYFVPSLGRISVAFGMRHDVVGGSLMNIANSTPVVFTSFMLRLVVDVSSGSSPLLVSFIGEFVTEDDIGVGDIIGSAAFNILFVPGFISVFAKQPLLVNAWLILRDSTAFLAAAITVICVFADKKIFWYEGLLMVLLYFIYIVILVMNPFGESENSASTSQSSCCKQSPEAGEDTDNEKLAIVKKQDSQQNVNEEAASSENDKTEASDENDAFSLPSSKLGRVFWVVKLPMAITLALLIPNFRRPGCWENLFVVTFINSTLVMAVLSWIMMWMVSILGYAFKIRESVMGLTLLAAGTSLPDVFASLYAVQMGFADMAISNCIANNVFELLFCLGLPLFLRTLMLKRHHSLRLHDTALIYSAITLIISNFMVPLFFFKNKWTLDRSIGCWFLTSYALVILLICLLEFYLFSAPGAC